LSWSLRLAYAFGQMPEGIKSAAFGFFLLFYYNQVLGLSASAASLAIFIALVLDAFSDPLVGSWSDSTRGRLGRRHPYMYAAALPFAILFFGLFAPPDGLGETGLFVWLLVFATLTRTAMTFYTVPYMAMGAELTADYDERTLLAAMRNVMQLVGMFAVLIGGNQMFFAASESFSNGQLDPAAYPMFALACVPLLVLGVLVAAGGTHAQIPNLRRLAADRAFSLREVGREVAMAFRIPSFTALVCASVVFGITQGMVQALILYTATYFFELSAGQITSLFAIAVVGIVCGSLMSRPAARWIKEKRTLFALGLAWYACFTSVVIILRLLELLPPNSDPLIAPLYIGSAFVSALGLGVAIPMIGSMIADITDEHERRYGDRQEGIYYAAASFAGKMIGGAGPVMAGIVIDLAGIPPGTAPAAVAAETVSRFGWLQGPSVLILSAVSIIAIMFYRITRARHAEILQEIAAAGAPRAFQARVQSEEAALIGSPRPQ
jgi:glycoside/pentoside/hexuronide:cation symporter, GPH family